MKTLTLIPHLYDMEVRLKGLSLKKIKQCNSLRSVLCIYDYKYGFFIWNSPSDKRGSLDKTDLIRYIKELHSAIPFDKIKMEGYELTGEQLMIEILK